jgi:hypothetical protein
MKNFFVMIIAFCLCGSALAFKPDAGMWQIDSEATGAPGRGFTLDVQNEIAFFTYYGYRADGSSVFYVASGAIVNNSITADLLSVSGGTVLGSPYKAAAVGASPGKVTLSFTSGTHGTITLPGESAKAISKYGFGYVNGPDGLMGTWLFSETAGTFAYRYVLTTKLAASSSGNGLASTASGDFSCEFIISGSFTGNIICARTSTTTDAYLMRLSSDLATGVSLFGNAVYDAVALRVATKTGTRTGLNNGVTTANVQIYDAGVRAQSDAPPASAVDAERAAAVRAWIIEMQRIVASSK